MAAATLVYFGGGTTLFFWVYGIVSFVLDVKNKFVPGACTLYRNWQAARREDEEEEERERREEQLY